MALPEEYTFGMVVARAVQAVADGSDEDRLPDMIAAGGTVTFRPLDKRRKTTNYSALVLHQNVKGTFYVPDPESSSQAYPPGTLLDPQGNEGVWLVTGTYIAEYNLNDGTHPPTMFTLMASNDADNPLDIVHVDGPEEPHGVQLVTAEIPPGGREDQTLVRLPNGQLAWQDILDDETAWRAEKAAQDAAAAQQDAAVAQQIAEDRADELRAMIPNVFVQDTPPEEPRPGDLWLDTTVGVI